MDSDEFLLILRHSGVDVWDLIDAAISVAHLDYGDELRRRRPGIVERIYSSSGCCNFEDEKGKSPSISQFTERTESEDRCEEESRILDIKEALEYPDQHSDESIVDFLIDLDDMEITFNALKETAIGGPVNQLRKHRCDDVRIMAKHLVSKWRNVADEWVKLNPTGELTAGDTQSQKIAKTGHQETRKDSNPEIEKRGWDKNVAEPEAEVKAAQSVGVPPNLTIDAQKFDATRKRLRESYQQAQNAKKQRTIRVLDIHDIPKPTNAFLPEPKPKPKPKPASHRRRC